MTNTQETIADIIAEMRDWLGDANSYDLRSFADRLEAARKRELATAKKSLVVGDAAKLREALEACVAEMCDRCRELAAARGNPLPCLNGCEPVREAKLALSEPVRNCEVGTAEEQEKRYNEWLNTDAGRAIFGLDPLEWAQMPYGEGGAK